MAINSSQFELLALESGSTRLIETATGSHRFKVEGYSFDWAPDLGFSVKSDTFTVGGYECVIKYSPDCFGRKDRLAFTLDLKSETALVKARVDFTLLDQNGKPSTLSKSMVWTFGKTFLFKREPLDYHVLRKTFEASDCLKNDSFTLVCTVTVVKRAQVESVKPVQEVQMPPSNLDRHLCNLLESGKGADVVIKFKGQTFNAHKCILAARSPVFSAQFFGPISEKGEENIELNEIEPEVFRVFLHFLYSDSLPELEGKVVYGEKQRDEMVTYQHLLVVADQYEVERLKIICENKLSQNIEVNNFATIIALAEQHNCSRLKASCLEFVSSPKILVEVMKTDGFEHLTRTCPFILKELIENTNDK